MLFGSDSRMKATLSIMWSISALFAVQFTRSNRAGSLPSSMSILAAVKPMSMIWAMNSLALGSLRLSVPESQYMRMRSRILPPSN